MKSSHVYKDITDCAENAEQFSKIKEILLDSINKLEYKNDGRSYIGRTSLVKR